jgi:hypothetical protein
LPPSIPPSVIGIDDRAWRRNADGKHEPLRKTCRRASSRREGQVVDEMLETPGSSDVGR